MGWRKIIESSDLVVYEREFNGSIVKIEARLTEDQNWEIFEIMVKDQDSCVLKEFVTDDKNKAQKLITELLEEKDPKHSMPKKLFSVSMKRIFKEEMVEKWQFFLNSEAVRNFAYVHFLDTPHVDIIANQKYKHFETEIITELESKLGLKSLADDVNFEIFYYAASECKRQESFPFGKIYVEFD